MARPDLLSSLAVLYVAFLRAINTGKRRIKMADLRSAFVAGGHPDATTHLATGNVVFGADRAPDPETIERFLDDAFGFENKVFLRSAGEVEALLEAVPWTGADGVVEVSFLEGLPDPEAARRLEATAEPPEALKVVRREVLFLREGKGIPTVHKESTTERVLAMKTTRRGIATVKGIAERYLRT